MISDNETAGAHGAENAAGQTPAAGSAGDGFWRIEHVSARTGLTKRTLRYYEEIGLLAPPTRTEGGYRLYSEDDIQHLQRIKRLKDLLGFSLAEIREIAQAEEEREQVRAAWASESDPHTRLAWMDHMADLTRQQLRLIEEKLVGLQDMRATLQTRLEAQERRREELQQQLAEAEEAR
jgi:MerR family transcriptional regulator, repressor of the yfmOP operon